MLKIPLFINSWDKKSFFDKQVLKDACDSVYSAGGDNKAVKLLYKLNQNTKIQVSTPQGTTDTDMTGENTDMGSLPAALVCSLSLIYIYIYIFNPDIYTK